MTAHPEILCQLELVQHVHSSSRHCVLQALVNFAADMAAGCFLSTGYLYVMAVAF